MVPTTVRNVRSHHHAVASAPTSAAARPRRRLPVPHVVSTARTQAEENGRTIQAGSGFLRESAAIFGGASADGKFLENISKIAHIGLLNPFLMLRCTA